VLGTIKVTCCDSVSNASIIEYTAKKRPKHTKRNSKKHENSSLAKHRCQPFKTPIKTQANTHTHTHTHKNTH